MMRNDEESLQQFMMRLKMLAPQRNIQSAVKLLICCSAAASNDSCLYYDWWHEEGEAYGVQLRNTRHTAQVTDDRR